MEEKKLIQFQNIVKDFDGTLVLKGINLDIYERGACDFRRGGYHGCASL